MKQLSPQKIQELMMLHQQGEYKKAVIMAEGLLKDFPNELMLHNILGLCQEGQGLFSEASQAYQKALEINPAIPELQFNLGAMLYAMNDHNGAIIHYQKAINLNPNFVEAFFNLGIVLQNQAKHKEAVVAYQKAVNLQPGFYEAIGNMGTIKQLQGDLDEAIRLFEQSIAIYEDARGHYNLACAYRNQGSLPLSIKHYRRAIEIGSGEAEFYSDLGDTLWHDGNIEEASRFLRMAVEIDSSHPKANYQLAIFLYDNKAFDEAIKYFEVSQFEDWQERVLYCLYKLEQFDMFKERLLQVIDKNNISPFLATLSNHYAQNFKTKDEYNFCPTPLNFVCHEEVPELLADNGRLIDELLNDIGSVDISQRKQSRLFFGSQSAGNLFKRSERSFKVLKDALKKVIQRYYLRHKNDSCEFIRSFPKSIDFSSSWYIKMQSGGHLTSHIHEEGWVSGAIYLLIPKKTQEGNEGAIELSTDGDEYPKLHDDFLKETILPKVGDVIFFPSSVFHRTIPFNSDEERICIAFDVRPEL